MIEIHLYGKLRRHAPCSRASGQSIVHVKPYPEETVASALKRVGIPLDDVYHVFLNGAILATRNAMAPWLRYQRAPGSSVGRADIREGLDAPVHDGDRLGLFSRDMGLLVV